MAPGSGPLGSWPRSWKLLDWGGITQSPERGCFSSFALVSSPGMVAELTSSRGGDVSGGEFHRETGIPPIRICLSTSSSLPGPRSLTVSGPLLIRTGCENTGVWSG